MHFGYSVSLTSIELPAHFQRKEGNFFAAPPIWLNMLVAFQESYYFVVEKVISDNFYIRFKSVHFCESSVEL